MLELSSKYYFAPVNTGYSDNGLPNERLIRFHRARSGPSLGISYVGNVSISEGFVTNSSTLVLKEDRVWSDLANTIHERGSLPGIQLACRNFFKAPERRWSTINKEYLIKEYSGFISDLSWRDIDKIFLMFIGSALKAYKYGFTVLQIHAAHGYFLSSLLSPSLNKRKDEYSIEKAGGLEVLVERIKNEVPDAILDFRLSCFEGIISAEEEWLIRKEQAQMFSNKGVDLISLSAGLYDFSKPLIYPNKRDGHLPYLGYAEDLAQLNPSLLVNVGGNFWDWEEPRSELNNVTYSIGRPLIADPEFVKKFLDGSSMEIVHCDRSGDCHYYTKGNENLTCKVNKSI